jgi:pyruvate formate lyase activating enzyme
MRRSNGSGEDLIGLVFNIQRFSVHDGPGIRTVVFMKGCPLRCLWCSNPEAQNCRPEMGYNAQRCLGSASCAACVDACRSCATQLVDQSGIKINRDLCTSCGSCADVCPAKARRILGEFFTVDSLIKIVEGDSSFFWRSGGGITVSGGEPLLQADFVEALLRRCRGRGIHTAIETSGYADWRDVSRVCQHANFVLYDIKHIDSLRHKELTGVGNETVLDNLKRLSTAFPEVEIVVRTPIVPRYNDSEENVWGIARFIEGLAGVKGYELLPYHAFGQPKYAQLGMRYQLEDLRPPSEEDMDRLRKAAYLNR